MRLLEAKPHTSVGRINEAQSHGEVCGVGRTAAATAARERRRRGGGGRHSIAYSKMLTNRRRAGRAKLRGRRRRRRFGSIQQVWFGLAVALASCQPTEQPSERFGGAGPPPPGSLTRFARLNANGRNSVHSPIDFPPIHFTHGQKSLCDVPSYEPHRMGLMGPTCSPSSRRQDCAWE